jgi:GNAT superfamily N-acetyltransferase
MFFPDLHRKPPGYTAPHPKAVAHLTWYTTPDLSAVRVINASVRDPWSPADLSCLLNDNHASTMVAKRGNVVVGFASYHLREKVIELVHFAVHKDHRHIGVGAQLFDTLDRKLSMHHLPRMTAAISELDGPTFAWFLGRGMRGCGVERDGIRPGIDAYLFEYWAADPMVTGVGNCPNECP